MTAQRLGLVGLGRWGRRYAATISRDDRVRLAAVTTSRPHSDLLPAGCVVFTHWPEMLQTAELDGVVLAVPPRLHRPIAVDCIERGLPVLVEKPMATTVEDALAIAELAERVRIPVLVDHTHLFSTAFIGLQDLIGSGPLTMEGIGGGPGPTERSVDPLWDWGPHDVAMTLALTGSLPVSVEARRSVVTSDGRSLTRVVLRFACGDTATLTVGNAMDDKTRVFRVDDGNQHLVYDDLADTRLIRRRDKQDEVVPVASGWPLDRVVEAFGHLAATGQQHPSARLGVDVVRVLEAATRSLEQSASVTVECG